jgi:cation transporter-like permease
LLPVILAIYYAVYDPDDLKIKIVFEPLVTTVGDPVTVPV